MKAIKFYSNSGDNIIEISSYEDFINEFGDGLKNSYRLKISEVDVDFARVLLDSYFEVGEGTATRSVKCILNTNITKRNEAIHYIESKKIKLNKHMNDLLKKFNVTTEQVNMVIHQYQSGRNFKTSSRAEDLIAENTKLGFDFRFYQDFQNGFPEEFLYMWNEDSIYVERGFN